LSGFNQLYEDHEVLDSFLFSLQHILLSPSSIMKFLLAIFVTAVAAAPIATPTDAIVGRDMQYIKREPIIDGNCKGLPPGACAGATK
jgi:hypothetical protein